MCQSSRGALYGAILCLSFISIIGGGCLAPCRAAQSGYEEALTREAHLLDEVPQEAKEDVHFAVGFSASFLTRAANDVVSHALNRALTSPSAGEGASEGPPFALRPRVENIQIQADGACGACVRIDADLGGRLEVKLPLLGTQEGSMGGRLSFVSPVHIERLTSGESVVRLDPAAGERLERPRVSLDLPWLPARWAQGVEERISTLVSYALRERFTALELARVNMPDLGVEGLVLHPTGIRTDAPTQTLLLVMTSNLSVSPSSSPAPVQAMLARHSSDVFIGVREDLLQALLQVLMQKGTIARRYTLQGKASPGGRMHVTLRELRLEPISREHGEAHSDGLDLQVGFDLWNLGRWGSCFSIAGAATGLVGLEKGDLRVEIEDVVFSESAMASPANWMGAQFLAQGSREALRQALERNVPLMSGVSLRFSGQTLSKEGDFVLLSATGTVEKSPVVGSKP